MKTKEQVEKETEYGHVYTIQEFFERVIGGSFNPYDGTGYFHDGAKETNRSVWDKDFSLVELKKYPFVCWYNK